MSPPVAPPPNDYALKQLRAQFQRFLAGEETGLLPEHFGTFYERQLHRETRKNEGVFYTPPEIVQIITKEALGDKRPLRILDPACGGGAFLVAAVRSLLNKSRKSLSPERVNSIKDSLYGVDADPQAVEVARLALQMTLIEQGLPAARRECSLPNIRCADALAPGAMEKLFPDVMAAGGFDAIIGNPPYLFGERRSSAWKQSVREYFQLARRQYDAYWLFTERALGLLAPGGVLSFVVPDALLAREDAAPLRHMLLESGLVSLHHAGPHFGAAVSACIFTVRKGARPRTIRSSILNKDQQTVHKCTKSRFLRDPAARFLIHATDEEATILERLRCGGPPLSQFVTLTRGEETGRKHLTSSGSVPVILGEDIAPYALRDPAHFIKAPTKSASHYAAPKIVLRKTGGHIVAALDNRGHVTMQSVYSLHLRPGSPAPEVFLAILNSRLMRFYVEKIFTAYKRVFPQLNQSTVLSIPMPPAFAEEESIIQLVRQRIAGATVDDQIEEWVERMYGYPRTVVSMRMP